MKPMFGGQLVEDDLARTQPSEGVSTPVAPSASPVSATDQPQPMFGGIPADEPLERNPTRPTFTSQRPPQSIEEMVLGTTSPQIAAEERLMGGPIMRGGMTNVRARFDIGGADNNAERVRAFTKHFPDGTIDQIPGTGTWVYRENASDPQESWKTVERQAKDFFDFSAMNPAAGAASLAGEIWGPVIGEILALGGTRGMGLIARAMRVGAGGASGEVARQATQEARGIGEQDALSIGTDAATAGAIGAGGFLAMEPLVRFLNMVSGRGALQTREEADEVIEIISRLNRELPEGSKIPELTPGQALDAVQWRRFEDQLVAVSGGVIRKHRQEQVAALRGLVHRQVDLDAISKAPDAAAEALSIADRRIRGAIARPDMSPQQLGDSLADAMKGYRRDSQIAVTAAYSEASGLGSPQFNMAPALDKATEITRPLMVARRMSEQDQALMRALDLDPNDARNREFFTQRGAPPEVQSVANQIADADPALLTLDNLMAWREELGELAFPGPDSLVRRPNRQARELYQSLTSVIENPTNLEGTFGAAWRRANDLASQRFKTLEAGVISTLARADDQLTIQTVAQLADTLIQPNQADNLVLLATMGKQGAQAQQAMQEMFVSRLTNMGDPSAMRAEFNRFDRETLNLLMPREQQQAFRQMIDQLDSLERTNVRQSLEMQSRATPLLDDILENRSTRGIEYLHDMVATTGGLNGEFGTALRHGLKDRLLRVAVMEPGGDKAVNTAALNTELRRYRERGLDRFLTTDDKNMLRDISKLSGFFDLIRFSTDAGTSIKAMEITSSLYDFKNPARMASGAWETLKAYGLSRMITSPTARNLLIGRAPQTDMDWLRISAVIAVEIERESVSEDQQ